MIQIKTLSLPVLSALLAAAATPASAQIRLELGSHKTYRQTKTGTDFRGGTFDVSLSDGDAITPLNGWCNWTSYYPAGFFRGICSGGTSAFLADGSIRTVLPSGRIRLTTAAEYPYVLVTGLVPALVVEPRRADLAFLRAAPASALPRGPQTAGNFEDKSASLYYNLHMADINEYVITRYEASRVYDPGAAERSRFEKEIVPGVYHYSFPRLNNTDAVAPIAATIRQMPEGVAKINSQKVGVSFNTASQSWSGGFLQLSATKPNTIKWSGFSPSFTLANVDKLYISVRELEEPSDPTSEVVRTRFGTDPLLFFGEVEMPSSLFPAFGNGEDPRISLASAARTTQFTLPPVAAFSGGAQDGMTGIVELEIERKYYSGGVSRDLSTRKFQIPVAFTSHYTDFAKKFFTTLTTARKLDMEPDFAGLQPFNPVKVGILDDQDGDTFNNLTEWILNSSPIDAHRTAADTVPALPTTTFTPTFTPPSYLANSDPFNPEVAVPATFGFTVAKKVSTVPAVVYTLERSIDGGLTYLPMVSDADWTVTDTASKITVNSNVLGDYIGGIFATTIVQVPVQPPGTLTHRYRIVITPAP